MAFIAALGQVDVPKDTDFNTLGDKLGNAQRKYRAITPSALSTQCLGTVASPGENALNGYLEAYGRLAACGATCDRSTVAGFETAWQEASTEYAAAKGALDLP